ncbi:MAG: hypothetical protein K0M66_12025 [Thiobacillus sp.]|nr:hypothetical protein [Thiobacillus sp.]
MAIMPLRSILAALWCLLCSVASADDSGITHLPPLTPTEFEAVVREIEAMVKTDESRVTDFFVREATPERIDRLYAMPELTRLEKQVRENGLIFAGRGSRLLTFDKPSDIVAKVASWFPGEIAQIRSAKEKKLWRGVIHLYGPFENWNAEPMAFLALWNCMPQIAWINPDRNPFERDPKIPFRLNPVAEKQNTEQESDFGFCVRERSGSQGGRTMEEYYANQEKVRRFAARATPILREKFARFLASNRCQGTGPDDCVLVLRLWASLLPADTKLAAMMQRLEAEIAPDRDLPPLRKPYIDRFVSERHDGEDRFDAGLRRAAYLRAKLLSVLNAPDAWPVEALGTTLHQMTRLRHAFVDPFALRWEYEIDYRNDPVNPWLVLSRELQSAGSLRKAIVAELDTLGEDVPCEVFKQWFDHGGKSLSTEFALKQLSAGRLSRCADPDWAWLAQDASGEAQYLRKQALELMNKSQSGAARDEMLSASTDNGARCFDRKALARAAWMQKLCKTWISEPQAVSLPTLKYTRLSLQDKVKFKPARSSSIGLGAATTADATSSWLMGLVGAMGSAAQAKMQSLVGELKRNDLWIVEATLWEHPEHSSVLMELTLTNPLPVRDARSLITDNRIMLVMNTDSFQLIDIPWRFHSNNDRDPIVNVSDLDQDGNLEVWLAESFRDCQGNDADFEREWDCSARHAVMGEINNGALSYFVQTPRAAKQTGARKSGSLQAFIAAEPVSLSINDQRSCNAIRVGAAFAGRTTIDFRPRQYEGNLIDLVCKPHPLDASLMIAAFFHELKDGQGNIIENDKDGVPAKGFVVAVIDSKSDKVVRQYRSTITEDATTRIDGFNLRLDTARYNLAVGVRALGVRMNISHSPHCAEGGDGDYLWLFVEEGRRLRPVLKNFPMSYWAITHGAPACGPDPIGYTIDNVTLTLAVSDTKTNGWHDLEVTAHHVIETWSGDVESASKREIKTHPLGNVRSNGKVYPSDYVRSQLGWD